MLPKRQTRIDIEDWFMYRVLKSLLLSCKNGLEYKEEEVFFLYFMVVTIIFMAGTMTFNVLVTYNFS
ncbi:hypothetical protein RIR_jg27448.t1 [Rhizophagus irregularis DAOM 181602=DAOM 197198]|nr:hypothetical protein RIR_jg27448.t1 [Rhizophagus irregularis DAOM 181602=DAOM 197198]